NSLKQLAQVAGQYRGVKSAQDLARVNAQLRAQNLTPPLQDDQYSPENVQGVISQSENAQTQAMVQLRNHAQQQSDAWKERNYGLAVAKFKIYQDRMKHLNENGGKLTAPPQGLQDVAKEAIQEQYGSDYEHSDQAAFMVAQRAWEIQRTDHISEEDAIQQAMEEQNDILQADGDLSSYDKFKQSLGMDVKPTKKFSVTKGKGKPAPKPQEASGAPKAGDIQDGYKFKGGDPANPQNWEKQ
ncbi:MAG: hypothetical protein KGL35_06160, partial [Bradyrhizobium sp.]|nr:hypothetical protein [Bradyrhizobium sp.]